MESHEVTADVLRPDLLDRLRKPSVFDAMLIGVCGLSHEVRATYPMAPCVEITWRLARHAWGQGYAAEAAAAALVDGFDRIGLGEIFAWTADTNLRSQHVMQRLGMQRQPARDFDHPALPEGHALRRHVVYAVRAAGPADA